MPGPDHRYCVPVPAPPSVAFVAVLKVINDAKADLTKEEFVVFAELAALLLKNN